MTIEGIASGREMWWCGDGSDGEEEGKEVGLGEQTYIAVRNVSPLSSSPDRTQQKLPFLRFSTDLRLGGHTQLSVPLISRQSKQAKRFV